MGRHPKPFTEADMRACFAYGIMPYQLNQSAISDRVAAIAAAMSPSSSAHSLAKPLRTDLLTAGRKMGTI
jgi:hypothetical protein